MAKVICILIMMLLALPASAGFAQDQFFLQRVETFIQPQADDLTQGTATAAYKPILGIGDKDAGKLKGIARYGVLTVEPGGASALVSYPREEQIYFILEGTGTLLYDGQQVPVAMHDYMYMPVGVKHGITNPTDKPVRVLVMGFTMAPGKDVKPTPNLLKANVRDVKLVQASGHPPSSRYQLMMGPLGAVRSDGNVYGINAPQQAADFYIIDFAPGGTNKPHQHRGQEEIYYVLRGNGIMVAGLDEHGNDLRHPCVEGDVYYFAPETRVGFFSFAKEGDPHDQILAVRSNVIDPDDHGRTGR